MKKRKRKPARRPALLFEVLEYRQMLSTFEVINTNDSGAGSLRQALLDANASPGSDVIAFNLPAADANHVYYKDDGISGKVTRANITPTTASDDSTIADIDPDWAHSWWSIKPPSNLPRITGPTTVDGYAQAGSSVNTLSGGLNTVLRVELNGSLAGSTSSTVGLLFDASDSTVRGMSINSYWGGRSYRASPTNPPALWSKATSLAWIRAARSPARTRARL